VAHHDTISLIQHDLIFCRTNTDANGQVSRKSSKLCMELLVSKMGESLQSTY